MEQTDGDADMAREVAQSMLDDKVTELEEAQKQQPKEGKSVAEKIAARKEHKANIERIEKEIEQWQQIIQSGEDRQAEEKSRSVEADVESAEVESTGKNNSAEGGKGNSLFKYFEGTMSDLITKAKQSSKEFVKKIIAPVSTRLRQDLSDNGIEIDEEYKHVIDNSAIRHILNQHGSEN